MTSRFVINGRFVNQPLTGVQRYCFEVIRLLQDGAVLAPRPPLAEYEELGGRVIVTGGRLTGHSWEQLALPRSGLGRKPLLSPAGCGPVAHSNQVLTIHDLAPLDQPSSYSRPFALWYSYLLPVLAKKVRKIVTVSQFSKCRILELLGVDEDKVVVAEAAMSTFFGPSPRAAIQETLDRHGISAPYFLAVSALSPRKNLARLLAAWNRVSGKMNGARLIIVGKERLAFSSTATLGPMPETVSHLTMVDDRDLMRLYGGAQGFLYPSLYEGFGLPILEAMACGCPVLTSDCTAMPEIAGNAAILVNPLREESIAEGIRVLADETYARGLRAKGFERTSAFSWARTAKIVEHALLA